MPKQDIVVGFHSSSKRQLTELRSRLGNAKDSDRAIAVFSPANIALLGLWQESYTL